MGGAFIAVANDGTAASWNPAGLAILEKPEACIVIRARDRQVDEDPPFVGESFGELGSVVYEGTGQRFQSTSRGLEFVSLAWPARVGGVKLVPQINFQNAIELGGRGRTQRPRAETYRFDYSNDLAQRDKTTSYREGNIIKSLETNFEGAIETWAVSLAAERSHRVQVGTSLTFWRGGALGTTTERSEDDDCSIWPLENEGLDDVRCNQRRRATVMWRQSRYRGMSLSLGALVRPSDSLSIGAVVKLPFNMRLVVDDTLEDAATTRWASGYLPSGDDVEYSADATTSYRTVRVTARDGRIEWPATFGIGLAFSPTERTATISTDVTFARWSRAKYAFVQYRDDFGLKEEDAVLLPDWPRPGPRVESGEFTVNWPSVSRLPQNDTLQFRIGTEWVIRKGSLLLPLRAGAFVDRSYSRTRAREDVRIETGTFWSTGWTAGLGVSYANLAADVAYVRQHGSIAAGVEFGTVRERALGRKRILSDRLYLSSTIHF